MPLQLGHVIDGKYRIVRLIGEGGMGEVYEGENLRIKRRVAIKLLHAGVASNTEMVQRFEREAQVAGTVGNDHILEILDLGALPDGERYMVMEFLDGETLTDRIKTHGRLLANDAVGLVRQVLEGLGAAHGAGIVHRDLKPDNIFILREKAGVRDYVKIIDFGISKFVESNGASSRMTRTGALMGTPHYMAPEQATGSSEIDFRTDIYAVGIILYEAVTGRVPFTAETFNQLLFEIALAKITPASTFVPDLDPAVDSIILRASARDPNQRFSSCREFIAALDSWEKTGSAVSVPPDQSIEAIVAATVPRAAPLPSSSSIDETIGSNTASGRRTAPSGVAQSSVAGAVSGGGAAVSTTPQQPTVNSWANTSQVAGPPVNKGPLVAATVGGVCLLVAGVVGFVMFHRSSPDTAASAASGASATPVASAVPAATVAPEVTPAQPTSVADNPAAPKTGEAAETPHHTEPARATRERGHEHERTERKVETPKVETPKVETPKVEAPKEKTINFGY